MEGCGGEDGENQCNQSKIVEQTTRTTTAAAARTGKSCKGALYYSSVLKSKSKNPRCVGFTRSLQQVPSYIVSEAEVEASKEGRSLTDFRYACVGYSVYLENKGAHLSGDQKPRSELPVCVGLELLVDKKPVDHQAPARADVGEVRSYSQDGRPSPPQSRPHKAPHFMGEEFLTKFTRNAGLVASGVGRNMRKVGNYIKESVDDILYRRPK